MLKAQDSRGSAVHVAAGLITLAIALAMVGCGGDKKTTQTKTVNTQAPVVATPIVPVAAPPAVAVTAPAPVPKEVTYEDAETAFGERNYVEAVDLFTRYTERKSANPWGFYMLGLSAWKAGDLNTAEIGLTRAIELDPRHVKSYINLGRVRLDAGRTIDALAAIDSASVRDPESGTVLRLRGRACHQLGRRDEAIAAYKDAIRVDGSDAWSINNLALIYIEEERFDEALRALARATELQTDIAVFQNNLGMALEHAGHVREAEAAYGAAVALDGDYVNASNNLARIGGVVGEVGISPLDLAALAQEFVDEANQNSVATTSPLEP